MIPELVKTQEYHNVNSCNKCGGKNKIVSTIGNYDEEVYTECTACGFDDFWSFGYFESMDDGYDNCEKY